MHLFLAIAIALLSSSSAARADPLITPLVTEFLVATLGFTAGATVTSITAGLISAIVTIGIGIGLVALFTPKPKKPVPEEGSLVVQSSLPYRIYGYGTARLSGALVFKEQEANLLGYIAVLNGHEVRGFQQIFLNDDQVGVPAAIDGRTLNGFVAPGADGRYEFLAVAIDCRVGLVPETYYSGLATTFTDIWGADFRGDGCASLQMVCASQSQSYYQTTFPYGPPQPSAIVDQYKLFDPRDDDQDPTNPSTWVFTDNVALAILHFQCFSVYGPQRIYATAIEPVLDVWIQAANDCDDLVNLKSGGTEKRYRLGGWITTEQDRRTTLQTMLACCDGHFVERGDGTIVLMVGKYVAPTVTLTDDDITGMFLQNGVASEDKVNQATAKYCSPDNSYTTVETDALLDASDIAARAGPPRAAQLDLTWVQSTGQASRLLKREFIKQQEPLSGKLTLRISGINACYERWIQINSNSLPLLNGRVIENRKATISLLQQSIEIDFKGSGPQIDDYTAAIDESAPPVVAQRAQNIGIPIPASVVVVAEEITDPSGSTNVYLNVSWDAAVVNGNETVFDYVIQYRIHDVGGGTPGGWVTLSFLAPPIVAHRVSVDTPLVIVGTTLDVQVLTVATGATLSTGSTIVEVDTTLSGAAPGPMIGFTATGSSGHCALSCTNPNSPNFSAGVFYRNTVGGSFATATLINLTPIYGAPNGTTNYNAALAAGSYAFWAVAENMAGTQSAPTGPVTATVT